MSKRVLIVCPKNAATSQMAEGLWRKVTNGEWFVQSAGMAPDTKVHPLAIQAMSEVGVDISQQGCKGIADVAGEDFDLIVSLLEKSEGKSPLPSAKGLQHWPVDDPLEEEASQEEPLVAFRDARDELNRRIRDHLGIEEANTAKFLDRDLSWLEFNRRVLHEALDERTPLLERLMFLGIFTSNLDEFFMKRVGRLTGDVSGKPPQIKQLEALRNAIVPMLADQARVFREQLRPALAEHGIHLLNWNKMTDQERDEANQFFRRNVFPVLTPQSVDPSHPFPFMSSLSDSLAIALRYPDDDRKLFARVKVPQQMPQWVELSGNDKSSKRFASLREIIRQNLGDLFPGMIIEEVLPLRVTRCVEVAPEAVKANDLLEQVEEELRQRRLQHVVRLEKAANPNQWLAERVSGELHLLPEQQFEMPGELDYTDFMSIASLPITGLRYPKWTPMVPPRLTKPNESIFDVIRSGDLLVHHPYESFDASVARFVRCAVDDDRVQAIKMTLYRTSDDTPFVPWLIEAAEKGKQVACLVELKARFDEHRNIRWANALEDAGVHVVYGVIGMKTHTKTALVVRSEEDGLRCYAHIGTGNYHPKTAKLYTDLGLFTCDPQITEDVVELFHYLTGRSMKRNYNKLLVAPVNMKERFLRMIERETEHHRHGRPAHIIAKMNQIEDRDVCQALYNASQSGVPIELNIRGFCVLRPGVPNLSENIRVTSVIGRFLEHSRIYYFRNGAEHAADGEFYIGSADWMHRNLEERVEAITPVEDPLLKQSLWDVLQITLNDQRQAWDMHSDGTYQQRTPDPNGPTSATRGTHHVLMQQTRKRSGFRQT